MPSLRIAIATCAEYPHLKADDDLLGKALCERDCEATATLRNPAELIAWNSDKTYLRELAERGIRTVPTVWVDRGSDLDLDSVLRREEWNQAVVKPVVDLGARNLRRTGAGEESSALSAVLRRGNAMVQPFLPSLEDQGELSLIYIAGQLDPRGPQAAEPLSNQHPPAAALLAAAALNLLQSS